MVAYNGEYGKHMWFAETADVAVEYARSSNGKRCEAAACCEFLPTTLIGVSAVAPPDT